MPSVRGLISHFDLICLHYLATGALVFIPNVQMQSTFTRFWTRQLNPESQKLKSCNLSEPHLVALVKSYGLDSEQFSSSLDSVPTKQDDVDMICQDLSKCQSNTIESWSLFVYEWWNVPHIHRMNHMTTIACQHYFKSCLCDKFSEPAQACWCQICVFCSALSEQKLI